jgi:tRNA (guanine-N7-)-methyltransferase
LPEETPGQSHDPRHRLYGRRIGRPLGHERQGAFDAFYPALAVGPELLTEDGSLTAARLFPDPARKLVYEIGFGGGEHLAGLIARDPGKNYLGAEPFINGMAGFLKLIEGIPDKSNIRALHDDAIRLARSLAAASVETLYILNPDPWHKKRHRKRRIVRQETLDIYARILEPGGMLVMATDVADLAEWMVTQASNHPAFEWTAEKADDWRVRPAGWIPTRYEEKGIRLGRRQSYLYFRRV